MTGYRRLNTEGIGAAAAEILQAVLEWMPAEHPPLDVGCVHRVFDRSLYIEVTDQYTTTVETPGPHLIVIGGSAFTGPLALRVATADPYGFDPSQVSTDTRCTLRCSSSSTASTSTYILSVGRALEIEFDRALPEPATRQARPAVDLASIHPESEIWRHAAKVAADLSESGAQDGLGWLNHLADGGDSPETPAELEGIVDAARQAVERGWEAQPPAAPTGLLGRGPGATPSGDDILAGIFLMLLRTTNGTAHERVQQAGDTLVALAGDRTTSISTALLAQAMRERAADPVLEAREAVLTPQMPVTDRRSILSSVQNIGHTSGLDTLIGMLVALLYIGPASHASGCS